LLIGLGLTIGFFVVAGWAFAQTTIHKNGFEIKPAWLKGAADAEFDEITHRIDDRDPRNGQGSEYIELNVKQGKSIHYVYPTAKAPISEEQRAAIWLRANRPGIKLMARVVLPAERDPNNLDYYLTTYIDGDTYQQTGQWQFLELARLVRLSKERQQLMNAQLKRPIDFNGAYIDALILNLNAGPGPTKVWIDDLEIGPVLAAAPAATTAPERIDNNNPPKISGITRPASRNAAVKFEGNRITVGNQRMFFRAIRFTDTMLPILRNAGFNTICFDSNVNPALVNEAADLGMWIVPECRVTNDQGQLLSADEITKQVNRFDNDSVLFRRISGVWAFEHAPLMSRVTEVARAADRGHPISADVRDGMLPYSRSVNLMGVHRFPLMTTLELPKYREWLDMRRKLAAPDAFTWTWIQTHLPDWYAELLYNQSAQAEFREPVGPQPEQIRLLAYMALASGYRGLGFWSDRFLADSHQGRDRLLACALLNQELDMIKDLLVTVEEPPQWVDTSSREVKAAVLRCNQGILVIPIWQGKFSQFVPGQAATSKLALIVPQVPKTTQAWEISPADVRGLKVERVDRGMKVTLPEFGLTSLVVFTSDTNLMGRFQDQARSRRQLASQWAHDMAVYEYEKVARVHIRLEQMGVTIPDGNSLLENSRSRWQKSKEYWEAKHFAEAYHEAERSLRPLRILMREHWQKAVNGKDSPVFSPYAVSFYSLPQHWQFMNQKANATVGGNVLRGGDFELPGERVQDSWKLEKSSLDELEMSADRVAHSSLAAADPKTGKAKPVTPIEGKQCLMLQIKPRADRATPPGLERTTLALSSPAVRLPPGSMVQISGWVHIPAPITASPDGALFYDNAGGEPLAMRWTDTMPWKKFTVYRKVPASGTVNVTLALTGIGAACFDDVRIEPLVPSGAIQPVEGR